MIGHVALAWACVTWVFCAAGRWKAAVIANAVSVGLVLIGCVGLIAYYDGKLDANGSAIIEGPEFFGAVGLVLLSAIWATVSLAIGALLMWIRKAMRGRAEMEQE